ncbi:GLABROUS1 enhancer-binding protein-like [Cicer arietinum]|uniref:Probable transcription factor At1g61730 n=1 Tax=Cicer arietinum TaxID=3827 RepID=A0A1S2XC45_CICAR|nr:probable transcription factor At1g61730 [Cicer arietinum]
MAPKKQRPSPIDEPPTASSSSSSSEEDDDQQPSSHQPEDEVEKSASSEEEDDEEEGSSEDEDEEDQPQPPSQPASKNPPPSTPSLKTKPSSSSEYETGSESDPEPTPPPNPKVKPLASKPMKAQPLAQAQSTPVPARSGTKRAAENGNDSKRSKKKTSAVTTGGDSDDEMEAEPTTGEDSKKLFQRLFSEEDELIILKNLADFISKTKKDPLKDHVAFHTFVKKSLHVDATSEQVKQKVRRLKKKFETSDSFTKPHDKKAFELYKKVRGNKPNKAEENGKNLKSPNKEASAKNGNEGPAKKELATKKEPEKVVENSSLPLTEMFRFDSGVGLSGLNENVAKKGLELIENSKRVDLEDKWKELQIVEMELFLERAQLIRDQTSALVKVQKKSSN